MSDEESPAGPQPAGLSRNARRRRRRGAPDAEAEPVAQAHGGAANLRRTQRCRSARRADDGDHSDRDIWVDRFVAATRFQSKKAIEILRRGAELVPRISRAEVAIAERLGEQFRNRTDRLTNLERTMLEDAQADVVALQLEFNNLAGASRAEVRQAKARLRAATSHALQLSRTMLDCQNRRTNQRPRQ